MKKIPTLFIFMLFMAAGPLCQAKTLDVIVFCSPASSASLFDFARTASKAKDLSEKGGTIICLNLDRFQGKDASWNSLWKFLNVDAALYPIDKVKTISGFNFISAESKANGKEAGKAETRANGKEAGKAENKANGKEAGKAENKVPGKAAGSPPILLFSGSEGEALKSANSVGAKIVFLASPVAREKAVNIGGTTFVYVPSSGDRLVQLKLESTGPGGVVTVSGLKVIRPREISQQVKKLLPPPSGITPADISKKIGEKKIVKLAPGSALSVSLFKEQKGVGIRVTGIKISRSFGIEKKEKGAYVILRVTFENCLSYKLVHNILTPVAYKVDNLLDHAFLYIDSRFVMAAGVAENPDLGERPHVLLPQKGAKKSVQLVFQVPAIPASSLDFIFLDEKRGHFLVNLWGKPSKEPAFIHKIEKNRFLEFGVLSTKEQDDFAGVAAGKDQTLFIVNLACKSILRGTFEGIECGFVVNFSPLSYIQLVEDDSFAWDPVETKTPFAFQGQQKFLPGLYNHGTIAFRIPKKHGKLKLCIFMPAKRTVSAGKLNEEKPETITVPLGGSKIDIPYPGEPLRTITDGEIIRIKIFKPEERQDRTIISGEVESLSKDVEIFRPSEQVVLQAKGKQVSADTISTGMLLRGAPKFLRLAPGSKRRFSLLYKAKGFGVVYRGFTRAEFTPFPGKEFTGEMENTGTIGQVGPGAKTGPGAKIGTGAKTGTGGKTGALASSFIKASHRTEPGGMSVKRRKLPTALPVKKTSAKPLGLKGVNLTVEQVNEAIEKGASFLAAKLLSGGTGFVEYDYLAGYAVLHSKRFREDPQLATFVIDLFRKRPAVGTYSTALRIMGLRALDPASNRKLISQCASFLVASQSTNGLWGYGSAQTQEPEEPKGELVVVGGRPIKGYGTGLSLVTEKIPLLRDSVWRHAGGDLSCTQYAGLGLKAAEESNVRISKSVWKELAKGVGQGQTDDGGWSYGSSGGSSGYGSMTVAGFATYLISTHFAGIKPDPGIVQKGYNWISSYFTLDENPGASSWQYYYLYGLERAGVIANVDFFGEKEWYPLLAKKLLAEQHADGSWLSKDKSDSVLDTCFAVLCLSRSTVPLNVEPLQPQKGMGGIVTGRKGSAQVIYFIFDASRSMRAPFEGKTRLYWAKKTVQRVVEGLPRFAVVALRVYGARTRPNNPDAGTDSVLLVPPVPGSKKVVPKILKLISANGRTPLAYSLGEVKKDLEKLPGETKATVVLLADGEESETNTHPFAEAASLRQRPNTKFLVIALATEEAATLFLKHLAQAGKGDFYFTTDIKKLDEAVEKGIWRHTPFVVRDRFGKKIKNGYIGENFPLPEGRYEIEVNAGGEAFVRPFWINTGEKTMILFNLPERR